MYAAATMSLGAVLLMLIATGAMVSGQQSMSTVDCPQYSTHFSVFHAIYHRKSSELIKHMHMHIYSYAGAYRLSSSLVLVLECMRLAIERGVLVAVSKRLS